MIRLAKLWPKWCCKRLTHLWRYFVTVDRPEPVMDFGQGTDYGVILHMRRCAACGVTEVIDEEFV